jgi:N-glycosylase/DNA lyase
MMSPVPAKLLREVALEVARCVQIRRVDWRVKTEKALWYELCACLLGSQVRFEQAHMAVRRLRAAGLLMPRGGSDMRRFERTVARVLGSSGSEGARYRFAQSKARQLRRAVAAIYGSGGSIRALLREARDSRQARSQLVGVLPGIGPKQASLFLRNVGYADDLAVLDTHVMRYLSWTEALSASELHVGSLIRYERVEQVFRRHADETGARLSDLDVGVWVTVRVLCSRSEQWAL